MEGQCEVANLFLLQSALPLIDKPVSYAWAAKIFHDVGRAQQYLGFTRQAWHRVEKVWGRVVFQQEFELVMLGAIAPFING